MFAEPAPQYRLWTWLLFYLTGRLFMIRWSPVGSDPRKVVKGAMIAIPVYLSLHWFYERHFFRPCF